jgi:hypothetical protein
VLSEAEVVAVKAILSDPRALEEQWNAIFKLVKVKLNQGSLVQHAKTLAAVQAVVTEGVSEAREAGRAALLDAQRSVTSAAATKTPSLLSHLPGTPSASRAASPRVLEALFAGKTGAAGGERRRSAGDKPPSSPLRPPSPDSAVRLDKLEHAVSDLGVELDAVKARLDALLDYVKEGGVLVEYVKQAVKTTEDKCHKVFCAVDAELRLIKADLASRDELVDYDDEGAGLDMPSTKTAY